jgi:hypothetical protein
MTTPLLEAAYLLQAFVAAIEALQISSVFYGYLPHGVYSFVYLLPFPFLLLTNLPPQRSQFGPHFGSPPPLYNPCADQNLQPIPQANTSLRADKINHRIRALGLAPHLQHCGIHLECVLQACKHHLIVHLHLVCIPSAFGVALIVAGFFF